MLFLYMGWVIGTLTIISAALMMVSLCSNIMTFHLLNVNKIVGLYLFLGHNNVLFFMLLTFISFSVFLWARYYMSHSLSLTLFFMALLIFVISMLSLVLGESFLLVFIGWEGLGVSSFVLIIFYQNWNSVNGGLLTLLTNRVGDALVVLSLCWWVAVSSYSFVFSDSMMVLVTLIVLSFTKSAQWPFISWLPAAMAAPTPVSALVHSSTLVTAGIWLLIRFSISSNVNSGVVLFIGSMTLLVASSAALLETDAKKVVALSTLSQLGLMILAIFMGGKIISFFHLISHALAKANLFMVVGSLIHSSFSQQSYRAMSIYSPMFTLCLFVSVTSLSGLGFMSGTYSKEEVLKTHFSYLSSVLSFLFVILIIVLTLSYCLNFSLGLMAFMMEHASSNKNISNSGCIPIVILSTATICMGPSLLYGLSFSFLTNKSFNFYMLLLVLFFSFMLLTPNKPKSLFMKQETLTKGISLSLMRMKLISMKMSSTLLEPIYLGLGIMNKSILVFNMMGVTFLVLSVFLSMSAF